MNTTTNYDAWRINASDYPETGTFEQQAEFICAYGTLAASTHNTQPWTFTLSKDRRIVIKPDYDYALPEADPSQRNMFMSIGACAANIQTAAAYFGHATKLTIHDDDPWNESVTVTFVQGAPHTAHAARFTGMTVRFSDKASIRSEPIAPDVLTRLTDSAQLGTHTVVGTSTDKELQTRLSHLLDADGTVFAHAQFGKELSQWLRSNGTRSYDGMPGFMSGLHSSKVTVGKLLMSHAPATIPKLAKKYSTMIEHSPAVAAITTPSDHVRDWVHSGIAYQNFANAAAAESISCTPIAAATEGPHRSDYRAIVGHSERTHPYVQLVYRIVRVPTDSPVKHTPRRPIDFSMQRVDTQLLRQPHTSIKNIVCGSYRINYVRSGSQQNPPLVLIHGANMGWRQWHTTITQLSETYCVYALDLPGSGASSKPTYDTLRIPDYVKVVESFIDQLSIHSPFVVGHSFGGLIALTLQISNILPIRKAVVVSSMGLTRYVQPKQKLVSSKLFTTLLTKGPLKPSHKTMHNFLRGPLHNPDTLDATFADYYTAMTMQHPTTHPLFFMNSLIRGLSITKEADVSGKLHTLTVPTLALFGEHDPLIPLKKIRSTVQKADTIQAMVLHDCGHAPPLEKPHVFVRAVREFCR